MKINVSVDVWECSIRLFTPEGYDVLDAVSDVSRATAEKFVNANGAINISGQYGHITVTVKPERFLACVLRQTGERMQQIEAKMKEERGESIRKSNALYDLMVMIMNGASQDDLVAAVKEAAGIYDEWWMTHAVGHHRGETWELITKRS